MECSAKIASVRENRGPVSYFVVTISNPLTGAVARVTRGAYTAAEAASLVRAEISRRITGLPLSVNEFQISVRSA